MQKYVYSETRGGLVPDEPGNNTDPVPYTGGWYRAEDVERLWATCERLRELVDSKSDPRVSDEDRAALAGEVQDD